MRRRRLGCCRSCARCWTWARAQMRSTSWRDKGPRTKARQSGGPLSVVHSDEARSAEFFGQFRHDREEIGHKAVIGDLKDRGLFVLVDRDDDLGVLHAREMLDGTRDADGDIKLGRHHLAGL